MDHEVEYMNYEWLHDQNDHKISTSKMFFILLENFFETKSIVSINKINIMKHLRCTKREPYVALFPAGKSLFSTLYCS